MKLYEVKPTFENLQSTFINDSIGRTTDVCLFVKALYSIDNTVTFGIDGKWGTGKTFFVKQAKMVIDSLNPNSIEYSFDKMDQIKKEFLSKTDNDLNKYVPYVTAYYDAWQHDSDDDPILSLVYQIMKDNNNVEIDKKRDRTKILTNLFDVLSKRNITNLVQSIKGNDYCETERGQDDLSSIINEFFVSLLPEKGCKLIVFIDELDRCTPSYAVKLLERIKHYFSIDNVIFVFSVNFMELQHTVNNYYGEKFDSCRYMDRFFDIRIELPPVDKKKYLNNIGMIGHKNIREAVCIEVVKQMNMSLRETSRYLAMSKIAAYKFTDGSEYEKQGYRLRDDGMSRLIELCVILPIAIGLKMTDSQAYDEFINGKNSSWLYNIITSENIGDWVVKWLLGDNESYAESKGKELVNKNDKINELYDAIFNKEYEKSRDYETTIGQVVCDEKSKEVILKALGFVSPYTDFECF